MRINFAWNANTEPGIQGYKIYAGRTTGTYDDSASPKDMGNVLTGFYEVFQWGTWYFALTAYTATDESGFSAEIETFVASGQITQLRGGGIPSRRFGDFQGDVGLTLTGVSATANVGAVAKIGRPLTQLRGGGIPSRRFGDFQVAPAGATLTGVSASIGFSVLTGGPVFPEGVFPGEIFPPGVFPSEPGGITDSGIGILVPSTTVLAPGIVIEGTVAFVTAGSDKVAVLSGVTVEATAGTLVVGRSKSLAGVAVNAAAGLVAETNSHLLSGVSVNVSVQTLVSSKSKALNGAVANATTGQTVVQRLQTLTGVVIQAEAGFATGGSDKLANLSGVTATATAGNVNAPLVTAAAQVAVSTVVANFTLVGVGAVGEATAGTLATDKSRALLGASANATTGVLIPNLPGILGSVTPSAAAGILSVVHSGILSSLPILVTAGAVDSSPGAISVELTGVAASATAGSLTTDETRTLLGVNANAASGTVIYTEVALTGVGVYATAYFMTTGNDVVVPALTSAVSSVVGSILGVENVSTLAGSGVDATGTVGIIGTTPDLQQSLTGVAVNVAAGLVQRQEIALTGVGINAASGVVDNTVQKTLAAVTVNARAGFIVKAGDVIDSLEGVEVIVEVGILGAVPSIPISNYRHVAAGPIRNRRIKDLESLEREMALMEE